MINNKSLIDKNDNFKDNLNEDSFYYQVKSLNKKSKNSSSNEISNKINN